MSRRQHTMTKAHVNRDRVSLAGREHQRHLTGDLHEHFGDSEMSKGQRERTMSWDGR